VPLTLLLPIAMKLKDLMTKDIPGRVWLWILLLGGLLYCLYQAAVVSQDMSDKIARRGGLRNIPAVEYDAYVDHLWQWLYLGLGWVALIGLILFYVHRQRTLARRHQELLDALRSSQK
jgi:hypothetical protein